MRKVLICAALAAAVSTPSMAAVAPSAGEAAKNASAQEAAPARGRALYICDASDMTRRAFTREYGVMEFVTAEAAAQAQEAWSAPRCITRTEYRRLQQMVSRNDR